jgi:hypothetical protein
MIPDLNRMAGVGAYTAAGDDDGFIRMRDMGNDLALSLIPKKSTYDNCTAHFKFI